MYSLATNWSNMRFLTIPRSLNRICAHFGCNHADHNVGTKFLVVSRETGGFRMFIGVVVVVWGCRSGRGRRAKEYKTRKPKVRPTNTIRREDGSRYGGRARTRGFAGLINERPGNRARAFIYYSRVFIIGGFAREKEKCIHAPDDGATPTKIMTRIITTIKYTNVYLREKQPPTYRKKNKNGTRKRDVRYRCLVVLIRLFGRRYLCA